MGMTSMSLIELAPAPIAYVDADGNYQKMSRAYEAWCGFSRDSLIGRHYSEVVPLLFGRAYYERIAESLANALRGVSLTFEGEVSTSTGERYVQVSYTPHLDESDGSVCGVLVMMSDVTELKRAESVAQDVQQRLAIAAEASEMGVWDRDIRTDKIRWDEACFRLMGFNPAEGEPSIETFEAKIHQDDRRGRAEANRRAEREGKTYECEYRVQLPDGTWRWVSSRGRFIKDENGEGVRITGVVFDISSRKAAEERAVREADRVRNILESTTDGVFTVDSVWRFTYVNSCAQRVLGDESRLIGKKIWDVFPRALGTKFESEYAITMADRVPRVFVEYYPEPICGWFEVHVYPSDDGGITGFFRDITDRRQAEERLRLHRQAIEAVPVGITIAECSREKDFPLVYVNPAFETMTGYTLGEVAGRNCRFLQGAETRQSARQQIRESIESGTPARVILHNYKKDGTPFLNELQLSPVTDEGGTITHFVGIQTDVTEHIATRERLAKQAQFDALTSIPNRYLFMDRLRQALISAARRSDKVAVIYLDVDNLKHVNDSLGHTYGDQLLKEVARRITSAVRSSDSVARLGGDEFGIFCVGCSDSAELEALMTRIHDRVSAPIHLGLREVVATASLGYSCFPDDSRDAGDLLRMADLAMYSAKRESRNAWKAYDPAFDSGRQQLLEIASGLRSAIRNREFRLLYQPRVDSRTGSLTGLEALIRWDSPERGTLSPAAFIGIAEETGLIREIGAWVIEEAVRQIREWRQQGLSAVPVSVNVSPVQFRRANFSDIVQSIVRSSGISPSQLELEVTESLLMEEHVSGPPLARLREFGLKVSIDDFGTGYSGLGYLARYPVDTIKIDRSFIQGISKSPASAAICETIIDLAHRLGLTTVAEGVETEEQAALLRDWRCDELQGYYFGCPLGASEVTQMLARLTRSQD